MLAWKGIATCSCSKHQYSCVGIHLCSCQPELSGLFTRRQVNCPCKSDAGGNLHDRGGKLKIEHFSAVVMQALIIVTLLCGELMKMVVMVC